MAHSLRASGLGLHNQPVFCFTSDIDWAPEWAISEIFDFFDSFDVPLTPFITHDSNVIRERFGRSDMRARVGLHPNFLPGSSHGRNSSEIIDHVRSLWPDSISFRSHSFFDNTGITDTFRQRGFLYDSNLCLFLQPNCVPLQHNSGMLRFPVIWEDDVHFRSGLPFNVRKFENYLDLPGLKVFNVHPFHFALNTPSQDYYSSHKHLNEGNETESWRDSVFEGEGTRTFIEDVLNLIRTKSYRHGYLYDLYLQIIREQSSEKTNTDEARQCADADKEHLLTAYRVASPEHRASIVRDNFDARDASQIYATSRDINLRELEISFIARNLIRGKVLDIGCGNGYTILSLAKKLEANFDGVDFSTNLIQGARKLSEQFAKDLRCFPDFQVSDVRRLPFADNSYDCVISERCLLNLPTKEDQYQTLREVHRVLKIGGVYVMVEGTEDGLSRLNDVRQRVGLEPIPSVSPDNVSSLKFHEDEINQFLKQLFEVETIHYFGTYFLISRVVHPLLTYPKSPRFDARINDIARKVAEVVPDVGRLGHVMGYKLVKKHA